MLARIKKLDLAAPGAVDDLLAFHRATFGGSRMEEAGDGETGDGESGDGENAGGKPAKKTAAKKATAKKASAAKSGDGESGDGEDEESEGERIAREYAEARTGRKSAELAISELTGKTITQVRKAFREAKGDAVAAVAKLTGDAGGGKSGSGAGGGKTGDGEAGAVDEAKIRREAEEKATEAANARLVRSELRVLASETFLNPTDAIANLDLDDYDVDDDGELVDPEKAKTDLAAVLKKFPHYAKKKGPKADRSQGNRGDGSGQRPKSMRDLSRMTVED